MILVLVSCLTLSHAFSVLEYETKPSYMSDSEVWNGWEVAPTDDEFFKKYQKDAQYLGLLFAGRSEFVWVVDIRVYYFDQEHMSIGNLISSKNVITTCRAALFLQEHKGELGGQGATVTFFRTYIREHMDKPYESTQEWPYGGKRSVINMVKHLKCNLDDNVRHFKWDIALLELNRNINPAVPFIGYMPVVLYDEKFLKNDGLERMEAQRRICVVGSIGRDYVNWSKHLVYDYKVRFRVYSEPWSTCQQQMREICDVRTHDCRRIKRGPWTAHGQNWICMMTRARVGTVCDHDRGAPVVCNGEVVGFVIFGARFEYCNNRLAMPFVVGRLSMFQSFLLQYPLNVRRRYETIGIGD